MNMKKPLLTLLLSLSCSSLAWSDSERYYLIKIDDQPVGYQQVTHLEKNQEITTEVRRRYKLLRWEDLVIFDSLTTYKEDQEGIPLTYSFQTTSQGGDILVDGSYENQVFTGEQYKDGVFFKGTYSVAGKEHPFQYFYPQHPIFPHHQQEVIQKAIADKTPQFDLTFTSHQKSFADELLTYKLQKNSNKDSLTHYLVYSQDNKIPYSSEWYNSDGVLVRSTVTMMKMSYELTEDVPQALEAFKKKPTFDILKAWSIKISPTILNPRSLRRAIFSLQAPEDLLSILPLNNEFQKVHDSKPGERILEVFTQDQKAQELTPQERQTYLESNPYVHPQAPAIRKVIRELELPSDPYEKAVMLREWVHDNITDKNLKVKFATDLETLKSGQGDCTEHAVLLTSLLRSTEIPARISIGYTLLGDTFIGHAWSEGYWDSRWHPLDAAVNTKTSDATHIKLSSLSLKGDQDFQEQLQQLTYGLVHMDIKVLETESPLGIQRFPEGEFFQREGNILQSQAYNFKATIPSSWELLKPEQTQFEKDPFLLAQLLSDQKAPIYIKGYDRNEFTLEQISEIYLKKGYLPLANNKQGENFFATSNEHNLLYIFERAEDWLLISAPGIYLEEKEAIDNFINSLEW